MAAKQVLFHEDVRHKLLEGVNILANAVKATLAPRAAMSCSSARSAPRQ